MAEVGLRELRQDASGVMRRVENGEVFTVTVSGRPVGTIQPMSPRRAWRPASELADLFSAPAGEYDDDWRGALDQSVVDPFERHHR